MVIRLRTVHRLLYKPGFLSVDWHRFDPETQQVIAPTFSAHYSAKREDVPAEFLSLWDQLAATIEQKAQALVRQQEQALWQQFGVEGVTIAALSLQWYEWCPDYDANIAAGFVVQYTRNRGGQPLPRWCDGQILCEIRKDPGPGDRPYRGYINSAKEIVPDGARLRAIARGIFDILRQAQVLADALDDSVSW